MNRRYVALLIILALAVLGTTLAFAQAKKAPETVVLKAPNGDVTFNHKAHVTAAKKCDTCHHASKPEKPATAPQQNCADCHTKTATPPMKTKLQAAFHNPTATAGTCIDCHKTGGKGPQKCADCHKKA